MEKQTNKPKYHSDPAYYENRNSQLFEDKKKLTMRELEKKYDLSETRIRAILRKFSNKFKGTK